MGVFVGSLLKIPVRCSVGPEQKLNHTRGWGDPLLGFTCGWFLLSETGERAGPLDMFDVSACPSNGGGRWAPGAASRRCEAHRSFGLDHLEMEEVT